MKIKKYKIIIFIKKMSLEKKKCPEGKILNPVTKRCVNENGKIGKQIKEGKVKRDEYI